MGPLEAFARRFKSHSRLEDDEQDKLSNAFAHTRISSAPLKPLPNLPPARTPSQLDHQRSQQLPHSISFSCLPSQSANGFHRVQQTASPVQRYMPIPAPNNVSTGQQQSQWIDHVAQSRMPNPWELAAPIPVSSLPPSMLTPPRRPARPLSAPVLPPSRTPVRRSKGTVTDPLQLPGVHQCWGIKRDGSRCTRKVGALSPSKATTRGHSKSPSPTKARVEAAATRNGSGTQANAIILSDSEEDSSDYFSEDDDKREYCHQHSKEINKTNGFILPGPRSTPSTKGKALMGDGLYVDFEAYLQELCGQGGSGEENCKAKLRTAMCQSPSNVDWLERGYLYIYELRDRSTPTHIALKVGRAVNVYKRFEQWRSQCQSKSPLLRAFFPRPEGVAQGVLPGAASVVEKGVLLSHKWERLCHIELAYLGRRLDDKCIDCKSRHREIFLLPRDIGYEGVRRVVERWLSFVRLVASDGMGVGAS